MSDTSFKFMTFNIEGLKSYRNSTLKITNFLNFISKLKLDVISLTEFDISSPNTLQSIKEILLKQNYILYTSSINKRSAIFFSKHLTIIREHPITQFIDSKSGSQNYLEDVTFSKDSFHFSFISVYTPVHNKGNKFNIRKMDFLNELTEAIESFKNRSPNEHLILAGDWNTLPYEALNLPKKISDFHNTLLNLGLLDCFLVGKNRHRNKSYTNIATHGTNNRLDRFLFNFELLNSYKVRYKMLPKLKFSTHMPIYMTLTSAVTSPNKLPKNEYIKKKTGIPKNLLRNKTMMEYLFKPTTIWQDNPSLTYDHYITSIHKRAASLSKMLNFLPKECQQNCVLSPNDPHSRYATLSLNYQKLRLRYGKKQMQDAEMPHSTALKAHSFYKELFRASNTMENPEHVAIFENFIQDIKFEKLDASEKSSLEAVFTKPELFSCLQKLVANGSSAPGYDALTYNNWFLSWEQSSPVIIFLANQLLQGNLLPGNNIAKVLIRLIPKKNYDRKKPSINDLRPISLTNSLFRLINYAITQRMMKPLNRIIPSNQQAFLRDRNIHLNIATTKMIAHDIVSTKSPNVNIMLIDFSKAFDNLDHSYMAKILQLYDFPSSLIKSVISQSSTSEAFLLNKNLILRNGFLMKKGVRQGLPFSPLLFILSIDILLRKIDSSIDGIKFNGSTLSTSTLSNSEIPIGKVMDLNPSSPFSTIVKTLAFADDIAIFHSNSSDLNKSLQVFSHFAIFSNLQLNERKTFIYTNDTDSNIESIQQSLPTTMSSISVVDLYTANPIYLGSPLITLDWENRLSTLKKRVNKILFMDLNLFQRVIGINTYVYSTIFFHDQHDPIPSALLKDFETFIKQTLVKFLPHPIPPKRIDWHGLHQHGGFALLDLQIQLLGRRAYFILLCTMRSPHLFLTTHPYINFLKQVLQSMTNVLVRNTNFWHTMFQHLNQQISYNHKAPAFPNTNCHFLGTWDTSTQLIHTFDYHVLLSQDSSLFQQGRQSMTNEQFLKSAFANITYYIYHEHVQKRHRYVEYRQHARINQIDAKFADPFKKRKLPHWEFQLAGISHIANIVPYLMAWYKIVTHKVGTSLPLRYYNTETYKNLLEHPGNLLDFREILNPTQPIQLESFKHVSKKTHSIQHQLTANISYWLKHLPTTSPDQWQGLIKRISHMHYVHHSHYNEVFELYAGLLTKCFYKICAFCTSKQGGVHHIFFHCETARKIHQLSDLSIIPLNQIVGPKYNMEEYKQINTCIKFLIFCHKEFYKYSKLYHQQLTIDINSVIKLKYNFLRIQMDNF